MDNRLKPLPEVGDLVQIQSGGAWLLVTKAQPGITQHTQRRVEIAGINLRDKKPVSRWSFHHSTHPKANIIRNGKAILVDGELPDP